MRKILTTLFVLGLLAPLAPASAAIGTSDNVPAATLLLPYFEVYLPDPVWQTTLFSINNASAEPVIAHVTLWTDLSVPTLDFNVYLTGYDVLTFNLGDLFGSGVVPGTDHVGVVSPVGLFSSPTSSNPAFAPDSCGDQLPLPPLPQILLDHIRAAHTGQASPIFGGLCSGRDLGDDTARGYITIDNVNFCSLDFPGSVGYFIDGGNGVASNGNVLWGDYFYVNVFEEQAQGGNLVHIEADDSLGAGDYTFYARYSGGADNREGLGSSFAARYANFGIAGGTDLVVWRDSKLDEGPFPCGGAPSWFPLSTNQIVIFDEQENPDVPSTSPFSPAIPGAELAPFPAESGRIRVGGPAFPVSFDAGWLYLNLNTSTGGLPAFDPVTQNWVGVLMSADGLFSEVHDSISLSNVTDASDIVLPICDGPPDPAGCP